VLTTAGNWLGAPIQKFRLTVEKPSDKALISLCAKGIKRAGPTTFTLAEDDYVPAGDLNVLLWSPCGIFDEDSRGAVLSPAPTVRALERYR
jgi:hypothetical protein